MGVDEVGFQRAAGFQISKLTGAEVHKFANLNIGWKRIGGISMPSVPPTAIEPVAMPSRRFEYAFLLKTNVCVSAKWQ